MSEGRIFSVDVRLDYEIADPCPILLAIEALEDGEQQVVFDRLTVNGRELPSLSSGASHADARYRWIEAAAGQLSIAYNAEVAIQRTETPLAKLPATRLALLPADVGPWLFASRYCDPLQFQPLLADEFGHELSAPGDGALMDRVRQWVQEHIAYQPVSDSSTGAGDTFIARAGVCRDFAHLMIAFARAAGVPARFVSSYAWALDPPDFHAVAELWLNGRWHMVDATGLAPTDSLIRIARTADGVGASFMTIFGSGTVVDQRVTVTQIN